MYINRETLKKIARDNVQKHYGVIMPAVLFASLVSGLLATYMEDYSFLIQVAFVPLPYGLATILLKLSAQQASSFSDLFKGYNYFWKLFLTSLLFGLKVLIGLILLVVPGIVFILEYSMVWFILAENPELSATDALKKSQKLMDGNKTELFFLLVSFIGWILLSAFTAGILYLFYVGPYMYFSITEFYKVISGSRIEVLEADFSNESGSEHGGVRE
ncbi:MAG: DUF975 family protein [Candidatus Cloacimonetes bacterium]|nr:DUF975 family protein [Candidatus Cloacimonadota bacterium]